jgi:hypothetical protein
MRGNAIETSRGRATTALVALASPSTFAKSGEDREYRMSRSRAASELARRVETRARSREWMQCAGGAS